MARGIEEIEGVEGIFNAASHEVIIWLVLFFFVCGMISSICGERGFLYFLPVLPSLSFFVSFKGTRASA